MCTLCRTKVRRGHLSTAKHGKALNRRLRAIHASVGRERRPYIPRDWDAEGVRAEHEAEWGTPEDLETRDPGTDTYVEF